MKHPLPGRKLIRVHRMLHHKNKLLRAHHPLQPRLVFKNHSAWYAPSIICIAGESFTNKRQHLTLYMYFFFFIKSATTASATPAARQDTNTTSALNAPSQEMADMSTASADKGVVVPGVGKVRTSIRCILIDKKGHLSIHISSWLNRSERKPMPDLRYVMLSQECKHCVVKQLFPSASNGRPSLFIERITRTDRDKAASHYRMQP